jgi:DNA-binding response OmpR family regulator
MMPHMDGWTTIRHIRKHSNLPVIIVSALGREKDVIRGLQIGADDFIVKPISQKMLLARVQANLRRVELSALATPDFDWRDDYLRVNIAARHVSTAGQQVELSPTEFELLAYLVHHAGETRTFTQILAHVWGDKNLYHTEYVHVYISRLRQKLEENPKEPVYLCSVHGIGYRFT